MRFFLISDNRDTQVGMRLAGIEGVIVHEYDEVKAALEKAVADKSIGVVLMTEKLIKLCEDIVFEMKIKQKTPLIAEIPDRHATSNISASISRYIEESIGVKL